MSEEMKMIIITSDPDLIKQFRFKQSRLTKIFTFHDDKLENSDFMNLTFAQLFQPNSTTDQLYKRALGSSEIDEDKPTKSCKKSNEIICTICGDRAIGYNYDALSCASCKAFFRRNANQDLNEIRCLGGDNQCSVSHEIRRKCLKCRLERCFSVGMKKSFLLNEEERSRRKHRADSQRNSTTNPIDIPLTTEDQNQIDQLLMEIDEINENPDKKASSGLSLNDWMLIQKIESLFLSIFQIKNDETNSNVDLSDRQTALLTWSQFANEVSMRSINFFRQIEQFENLSSGDRFTLIKYNLFSIYPLSKCFYFKRTNDCPSFELSEEAEKHRQFFDLCGVTTNIRKTFIEFIVHLIDITEQNPIILSLLFIILLFSPGLSLNCDEPALNDSLSVHRTQIQFTTLLHKYFIYKYGEKQSQNYVYRLFLVILEIQNQTKDFRTFFREQYTSLDAIHQIAPLMQSVLHFS